MTSSKEREADGGQAFPCYVQSSMNGYPIQEMAGMTLRDYFAGKSIGSVIVACASDTLQHGETQSEMLARKAYLVADAMLKARLQ